METDIGIMLLGSAMGAVWSAFKVYEHLQRARRDRFRKALMALEVGVERTYQAYVRAIKAGRADGRLTDSEKARARSLARTMAIALAREAGANLGKDIGGEEYVDMWIGKLVRRRKS